MKNKMMVSFLLMIAGVASLGFIAPWWAASPWIVIIALLTRLNKKQGIMSGTFSLGIVWLVMALYMSRLDDAGIIGKTGALLGGLSTPLMVILTLVIALLTGLFSGWLGSALSQAIFTKKNESV